LKVKRAKTNRLGRCKNQTTLLKKYEKRMKPIIIERDGAVCNIKGYRHECKDGLVADHRPSKRGHHSTFLDPRNLTCVCGNANFLAEKDAFISHAIVEVVVKREGNILEELSIESKKSKRWSEDECREWIIKCADYFETHKNGKPS